MKFLTADATGVMLTPLVTHADIESRTMLANMNPGSLVTRLRKRLAGPAKKPRNGSSGKFKLCIELYSAWSATM